MLVHPVRAFSLLAIAAGTFACSLGAKTIINETPLAATAGDGGAASTSAASTAAGATATCSGTFTSPDVSTLKTCQPHGHCYAKDKMAANVAAMLGPCDDPSELCVPDEILSANGAKLKQCTQTASVAAVAGPGGGCATIALLPPVQKGAGQFLTQQECDPNQVCVPCKNPQDNSSTPFCDVIGVYADACSAAPTGGDAAPSADAGAPQQPCCTTNGTSAGVCLSNTILPPANQGAMPQDDCATTDVCMPAALMQNKATTCDAGLLFGKGVCLDQCFNTLLKVAGVIDALPQDVCGATELCTPCSVLAGQMPAGVALPGCS